MINKNEIINLLELNLQESYNTTKKGYEIAMVDARAAEGAMQSRYSSAKEENHELAQNYILKMNELEKSLGLLHFWKSNLKIQNEAISGALIELRITGKTEKLWYFLFPVGGYEITTTIGQKIITLNTQSPLGKALLRQKSGNTVIVRNQEYEIISII